MEKLKDYNKLNTTMRVQESYDKKDELSIVSYAKKLINHSLSDIQAIKLLKLKELPSVNTKGKFGEFLEKYYFGIENNNKSEPDFKEVGIELKSTPLKRLKNGKYSPKERLVLNIINYDNITDETWETSHFLSKNEKLLLIFYLYENDKNFLDYLIKYVSSWELKGGDKEIIKQDWEKIINKIRDGKAHELSEGDTFYLGACRKGHKEKPRKYGVNNIPAKQRAFSFKPKFMKSIIEKIENSESIIKNVNELKTKNFEEIIHDKFKPFINLTTEQIKDRLELKIDIKIKSYYAILAKKMLNISAKNIEEFEKANVYMKTIRLSHNGMPVEDMSFPTFKYNEIINQNWGESDFFNILERKFFFVVYQMNKEKTVIFKKAFFWNIPAEDKAEAKKVWEETKKRIALQGGDNLPKKSENRVSHVRPHARNNEDTYPAPNGKEYVKKCFWLNSGYLKEQIEKNDF
jgi:DNA mismatch repair protein MutH